MPEATSVRHHTQMVSGFGIRSASTSCFQSSRRAEGGQLQSEDGVKKRTGQRRRKNLERLKMTKLGVEAGVDSIGEADGIV